MGSHAQSLRVMTFNVRQLEPDDEAMPWLARRELLAQTILDCDPDLIGTQELFVLQADYLLSRIPGYRWFGTGRYGDCRDKHNGVFYKPDRLELLDSGDLWLSATPERAGTTSWGILKPRTITWGKFQTRDKRIFFHFNTHFPYRKEDEEAREQTALLLLRRLELLRPATPVILTADANAEPGGTLYRMLTGSLRDAWTTAAQRETAGATLLFADKRIDWILFRGPWEVRYAATVPGRASDHYPVIADLISS